MWIYIIIAIVVLILIYFGVTYNSFVKLNNTVKEAFSTMDVYLKKRWDLIPNIVETVKGYAKHDKLSQGINKLMAIAEAYPDLKANENFKDLSQQLTKVEDDIANSRKYYNGAVRIFNDKVQMFPSNIVAGMLGFREQKMFEASESERETVQVKL